jgi:branched-chain amino acid transport system permease protein
MVIAGGSGTLAGPVVGATLVLVLKNVVSAYVERWLMLLGAAFVLLVVFVPDGIVPGVKQAWARRRAGAARRPDAQAAPPGSGRARAAAPRGGAA